MGQEELVVIAGGRENDGSEEEHSAGHAPGASTSCSPKPPYLCIPHVSWLHQLTDTCAAAGI